MTESKARTEEFKDLRHDNRAAKADAREAHVEAASATHQADALRTTMLDAIREIEGSVATQYCNEKFNDGARAAAQVLRSKIGLGHDEALPAASHEAA
jgi:Flp pilus assembly protein TadG